MTLRSLEKTKSSLVLVPVESEDQILNVDQAEINRLVREPQIVQAPLGIQVTSVRDQVVIVFGSKIVLEDQSDIMPSGAGKLPDVANSVVNMLRRQGVEKFRAYGWNFEAAFDAPGEEPAAALIANSFLNTRILADRAQIQAIGGGDQHLL